MSDVVSDQEDKSLDKLDPLSITDTDVERFLATKKPKNPSKRKHLEAKSTNNQEISKKQKTDIEGKNTNKIQSDAEEPISPLLISHVQSLNEETKVEDSGEQVRSVENEQREETPAEDESATLEELPGTSESGFKFKDDEDFNITEKLKEMAEISVKPVTKSEIEQQNKKAEHPEDNVSLELKKGDRKGINFRKNIKDVLDETQLDASTLAAQRLESERLARVQEQQRLIRDVQRQLAAEKQANKAEARVMSILQGHTTIKNLASTTISKSNDSLLLKNQTNQSNFLEGTSLLTPSVSITPTSKSPAALFREQLLHDETLADSEEEEPPAELIKQPIPQKKAVVMTIDSSSDSDDCIILSDDEEAEDPEDADPHNSGLHVNDAYNKPDSEGRVVVNIGHSPNEPDIYVAPQIARVIKPHQIGGVRFLFDNIIESVDRFDSSTGFGCILAHSMGLGKTVQLVCFCDIFLRHTSSRTVLIIMPINTLQNWINEFNMWTPSEEDKDKSKFNETGEVRPRTFKIHVLNDSHKTLISRAKVILEWLKDGGVLMMGYEIYRLLSQKKLSRPKKKRSKDIQIPEKTNTVEQQDMFDKIYAALVKPGPDLVVCDEGHRIKNAHASTSLALKQIKTKRRVVLTGYPLQNNLLEYWCMVDFVRPNYLGTKTEFSNMFERPIQNGQCIDSTPQDCKTMRYRAHVLHSLLLGFVQRRSHMVLQACLPQKQEYVLMVRTTPFQRKLYNVFMNDVIRTKTVPNPLKAFSVCCKIWNHPDVLYNFLKKREIDLEIEIDEIMNKDAATAENGSKTTPKKRGRKKNEAKETKETKARNNSKEVKEEKAPNATLLKSDESSSSSLTAMSSHSSSAVAKVEVKEEKIENNGNSLNQPENIFMTNPSTSFQDQQGFGYNSNFNNYGNNSYRNQHQSDSMGFYDQSNANYQGFDNFGSNGSNNYWQNNYYPPQNSEYPPSAQQNNYYQNNYQPYQDQATSNFTQPFQPEVVETKDVKVESIDIKPKLKDFNDSPDKSEVKKDKEVKQQLKELLEKKETQKLDKTEMDEKRKEIMLMKSMKEDGNIPYDWAVTLMKDYVQDILENSPKLEIFFCILNESVEMDDRVLVFSQSLLTLNIMERFLTRSKIPGKDVNWCKNQTYFRLDGSTGACEREKLINEFNSNHGVKLFLVSTRAGSLGINLVGANRVIVFDASWNPCHDTQAVCRVYRYGQQKACFIYRLVMDNCLEKKIYDRQINKQGMADRVVDECNPDAHLSMREVTSLCWNDGEETEIKDYSDKVDDHTDIVMKKILTHHSVCLTKEPFQHESLLVDRKEKKLSVAEKRLAKRGYELEKQAANKPAGFSYNSVGTNYRAFRGPDGVLIHRPVTSVRAMQNDLGDGINSIRSNNARPNRWIPAEVWQRQGMTAQEMTLPLDVTIPTSSADKSNIVLKAGQKVMVLKSPKGIYMQLETGKIIAIRTSVKMGHGSQGNPSHGPPLRPDHPSAFSKSGLPPMKPTFTSLQESAQSNNIPASARNHSLIKSAKLNVPGRSHNQHAHHPNRSHPMLAANHRSKPAINSSQEKSKASDDDVINISNDEDDEVPEKEVTPQNGASSKTIIETSPPPVVSKSPEVEKLDEQQFKEKVVYKPNLVGRKPRLNSGSQSSAPVQTVVQPTQTNFKQPPDFSNLDNSKKSFEKVEQAPAEINYEQSRAPKPSHNPQNSRRDDYSFYPQQRGGQGNYYNANTFNQPPPRYDNNPYDDGYGQLKPSGGFPGPTFTEPPPLESSALPKQELNFTANDSIEHQPNPLPIPSASHYPRERENSGDLAFRPTDNPAGYETSAPPFIPFQHYPNPNYPQYQNAPNPTYDYPYQSYNSGYPPVAPPSNSYPYPAANYPPIESQQYPYQQSPYGAPPINPVTPNYSQQAYPPAEQPATLPSFGQWNYNN